MLTDCTEIVDKLDLFDNRLPDIDGYSISSYSKLTKLYLKKNQISEVSSDAFRGMILESLDLRLNKLTCFPEFAEVHKTLKHLYMTENEIATCEGDEKKNEATFTMLQTLQIAQNKLSVLPKIIYKAKGIRNLHLRENHFTTMPNIFRILPKMQKSFFYLQITDNNFTCGKENSWLKRFLNRDECLICCPSTITTKTTTRLTTIKTTQKSTTQKSTTQISTTQKSSSQKSTIQKSTTQKTTTENTTTQKISTKNSTAQKTIKKTTAKKTSAKTKQQQTTSTKVKKAAGALKDKTTRERMKELNITMTTKKSSTKSSRIIFTQVTSKVKKPSEISLKPTSSRRPKLKFATFAIKSLHKTKANPVTPRKKPATIVPQPKTKKQSVLALKANRAQSKQRAKEKKISTKPKTRLVNVKSGGQVKDPTKRRTTKGDISFLLPFSY